MAIEVDRSRIIAHQRCPRERYLGYHHLGKGLQRRAKGLPLIFGSAFHEAAEELLNGDVETACYRAMHYLRDRFEARGVGLDGEDNQTDVALTYAAEEQMALAEGLIRAWGFARLEQFLETFEVLEVEQEGRAMLHEEKLVLLFRPDALLRDCLSGDIYIASWKTTSTYGKRNRDQARTDMQSMSEVWGVEQAMNERSAQEAQAWGTNGRRIEGVLYLWIVKGKRIEDKWDNLRKQNTPLIYGWKRVGTDVDDWSWTYAWEKEDGSGESRLGKGWKRVPVWREYPGGVKQWIDDLAHQRVFPRHLNALEGVFPESMPVERRRDEVESWERQVVAQELKVDHNLNELEDQGFDRAALDALFPQYTHSCHSYSGCQFIPICWDGVAAEEGELYTIRTANHPEKGDDNE